MIENYFTTFAGMKFSFLTRNIWYVSLISFFTDVASEMLYPIIPLYLSSIGISIAGIGVVEGIAETLAALSKTYFGIWSDRISKRKIFIIIGYALSGLSKPLMVIIPNYYWILLMRVSDRLGKGIRTAPRDALLSDESNEKNKGKVFGFHRSIDTFGAVIGPALTLLLILMYHWNYQYLFLLSIIPGIVATLLSFLIKENKPKIINSVKREKIKWRDLFIYWKRSSRNYKIISGLLILFYLFNSSDMLLLLKARSHHLDDYQVVVAYIVYNLSYAILAFPFGMIGDKLGLKNTIAFGLLFFGIVYLGVSFFTSYFEILLVFALYGVYSAAIEGNIKALLSNLCDASETATAIGLFTTLQSMTFIFSNTITGILWEKVNSTIPFVISGCVGILVSILLFSIKLNPFSKK